MVQTLEHSRELQHLWEQETGAQRGQVRQQARKEWVIKWDLYGNSGQGGQNKSGAQSPRTVSCLGQSQKSATEPSGEGFGEVCRWGVQRVLPTRRSPPHPPWDTLQEGLFQNLSFQEVSWPVVLPQGGTCDEAAAGPQVGVVRTEHSFNKHLLIVVLWSRAQHQCMQVNLAPMLTREQILARDSERTRHTWQIQYLAHGSYPVNACCWKEGRREEGRC